MELHQADAIRLNIGGGSKRFDGWTNVDLAEGADFVADVRSIPLPDDYADEAMAIHVLEHIQRWEALETLKEWRRVLKPGALLAVELPDLIKCCKSVLRRPEKPRLGIWGLYGDPGYENPLMVHKWGWTADELVAEMRAAGFKGVKVVEPKFHRKDRDMRVEGRA